MVVRHTYILDFNFLSLYGAGHLFLIGKVIYKWTKPILSESTILVCVHVYMYIIGTLEMYFC